METPFGEIPDDLLPGMTMADRNEFLVSKLSRRRVLKAGLVGAGAIVAGPMLWRTPGALAAPPAGAHLTLGPDPARDMCVSWMTKGPVRGARVDLGVDRTYGQRLVVDGRTVRGVETVYQHAIANDLMPATKYHYRISHNGGPARSGTFVTPPRVPRPFTFTAFGDQGVGEGAKESTDLVAKLDGDLHFHVGDLCYANPSGGTGAPGTTDPSVWDEWFRILSRVSSRTAWMPAMGNHEMETGYGPQGYSGSFARFTLPSSTAAPKAPAAYWFKYSNVAFFALDANDVSFELPANRGYSDGNQQEWLRRSLREARKDPDIDFIVAGYHHCSYCSNAVHASDGGVRDAWGEMFDEFSVDIVINGHNHCYERTHPIKGGVKTSDAASGTEIDSSTRGTVYITAGGGGQAAYQAALYPASYVTLEPAPISIDGTTPLNPLRAPEVADWSATRFLGLSLIHVDVAPARAGATPRMKVRALELDGSEIETFTMVRSAVRGRRAA